MTRASTPPSPTPRGTLLLIDDTPTNLEVLLDYLTEQGFEVLVAVDGVTGIERAKLTQPDLILLDVMMPIIDGFETCRRLKAFDETREIPVLFMTALTETADKVRGFAVGGVDYIAKPFQHEEVLARVTTHLTLRELRSELEVTNQLLEAKVEERTLELRSANERLDAALSELQRLRTLALEENAALLDELGRGSGFREIVTRSKLMKELLHQVAQVAPTGASVLVLGETGTGKELLARAVHDQSPRRGKPLVKVNCAALPETLIESELFGHEKGAFTGALATKIGRFELADGGTIFLDEIGDLPLALQSKLLRVLQEGEFERLGSPKTLKVDVRVIAATNRDLVHSMSQGQFREDLYYRLNVFPLENPPLRARLEDVPLLVQHFVTDYAKRSGGPQKTLPSSVLERLQGYDWPGNVRELQNVVERAMILSPGPELSLEDWPPRNRTAAAPAVPRGALSPARGFLTAAALRERERENLLAVLEIANWRVSGKGGAAELLGIKPSTLQSQLKAFGLTRPA
jgi:formate hydrogenlyase transcriptional activator